MGRKIYHCHSRGKNLSLIFTETRLKGAYVIEISRQEDERGFFARSWDKKILEENGLNSKIVQSNISFNKTKGTLRGMHYQIAPHEETKIIRCVKGKIFDVIVDIRPESKTFKELIGIELTENNYKMLYVPGGFAHGFQTLEDNTELSYQMSEFYMPEFARGIRWDDPAFKIDWPLESPIISNRDLSFSPFQG